MEKAFDARVLMREAEAQTGLSDWGDEAFREPFEILVKALNEEAQLHERGRIATRRRLGDLLRGRLQLFEDRKRFPQIKDERIVEPLIVLGMSRTGSTFFHNLIAQDPAHHAPRAWEIIFPSPPPERANYLTDPRIAMTHETLAAQGLLHPDVVRVHPLGAERPEECNQIWEMAFITPNFMAYWNVPSYMEYLLKANPDDFYGFEIKVLQALQFRNPGRWVLKGQPHMVWLDGMLKAFPDARFVMTHRDPARVIASLCALLIEFRRPFSDNIPRGNFGMAELQAQSIANVTRLREQPEFEKRFFDARFLDVMADPMAVVRKLYDFFGMSLTRQAEDSMNAWLIRDREEHTKGGKRNYALEDYDLTVEEIDRAWSGYMERYDVRPER